MLYVELLLKCKRHWMFFSKDKALKKDIELKASGKESTVSKLKGKWVVFQLN